MPKREQKDIFEAVRNGDAEAVKHFVEREGVSLTNLDSANQTVIHLAAENGNLNIIKFLLEKDPSLLDVRDRYNYNVLHRVTESGFLPIVKFLVDEFKANIYERINNVYGNTVLHVAAAADEMEILKYFIEEKGMDPALKNYYGQPAAFSAAANKKLAVIKYFVEQKKVDLTVLDRKNENILFTCVMRRDVRIPRYLLDDRKLQIDVNWRGHAGKTLLHWAARVTGIHFVRYLVEDKGSEVNVADDEGVTPLHQAARGNNLHVVKFFIKHKAKFRAVDKKNKTAVDYATDPVTISYLERVMQRRSRRVRSVLLESLVIPPETPIQYAHESLHWLPVRDTTLVGLSNLSESVIRIDMYNQFNGFLRLADILLRFLFQRDKKRFKVGNTDAFSNASILHQ